MKDVTQLIEDLEAENAKLKKADSRQSRSKALLDAVLLASNQWRLEMWRLRLDEATAPRMRDLIKVIMDRQLELEDEAKAFNGKDETQDD